MQKPRWRWFFSVGKRFLASSAAFDIVDSSFLVSFKIRL